METFLSVRDIQSKNNIVPLIVKYLKEMGYKTITCPEEANEFFESIDLASLVEGSVREDRCVNSLKEMVCKRLHQTIVTQDDWIEYQKN